MTERFISAISCLGEYRLTGEISKLCKLIYQFDDGFRGAAAALEHAALGAQRRGADVIACLSPLNPQRLEAVLIPQCSMAFVDSGWGLEEVRHMRIDALIPLETQRRLRPELRETARLKERTMELAYDKLRAAKALHDEMEAVYISHMDFAALTKYTDSEIKKLLK